MCIDGLVQDLTISSALAILSWTGYESKTYYCEADLHVISEIWKEQSSYQTVGLWWTKLHVQKLQYPIALIKPC